MDRECRVNTRLKRAIEKNFGSVEQLCQVWPGCKRSLEKVLGLIDCSKSPMLIAGRYCPVACAVSEAVAISPDKLFPVKLYARVLPRGVVAIASHRLSSRMAHNLDQLMAPANLIESAVDGRMLGSFLKRALSTLSPRERQVIELRYGLGDGWVYTLEEVGQIFGVEPERIHQIESKAVRKLQQPSRSQILVGFIH